MKEDYRNNVFSTWKVPSAMKSTDLEHALTVVLDSNAEEVELYRNSMSEDSTADFLKGFTLPEETSPNILSPFELDQEFPFNIEQQCTYSLLCFFNN